MVLDPSRAVPGAGRSPHATHNRAASTPLPGEPLASATRGGVRVSLMCMWPPLQGSRVSSWRLDVGLLCEPEPLQAIQHLCVLFTDASLSLGCRAVPAGHYRLSMQPHNIQGDASRPAPLHGRSHAYSPQDQLAYLCPCALWGPGHTPEGPSAGSKSPPDCLQTPPQS